MHIIHGTVGSTTVSLSATDYAPDAPVTLTAVMVYLTDEGEVRTITVDTRTPREQTDRIEWETECTEQHGGTVLHIVYGERDHGTGERSAWTRQ